MQGSAFFLDAKRGQGLLLLISTVFIPVISDLPSTSVFGTTCMYIGSWHSGCVLINMNIEMLRGGKMGRTFFMIMVVAAVIMAAAETDITDSASEGSYTNTDIIIENNNGNGADTARDTMLVDTTDGNGALRKRRAAAFNAAGFGPANLENVRSEGLAYNFFGGRFWEVNDYAAIKVLGETTTDFDNSFLIGAALGVNFYPLVTDISPYVGGEMGFAFSRGGGDNSFGLSFGGSVGVLFFRASDVQLNVEGKALVLLDETGRGYPATYAARLGLLF